ncbi:permuted papain-like amidase YaeF/Yiix C92 family enzyme [Tamilnaduibacter salinus]|uniref:Lipo-like protein n=1 Tax=Tamilnaduibacter salinus TaxID=1484056 RepID=A0A2A2I1M9_9GAMM|nr:YiiX/YebB-like N1pC/P60 family cysteine hydrolase [Tamilnaduibacter salinus]PAV25194.1 lipo-like protein [Tamilnaduibacter salinus]PVY69816.1 permuted papain-like amidase YaeF/Yiix C92 family enzyme [Tamilnaduibacter salinus]
MFLRWLSRRLVAYLSKQIQCHSVRTSTWEAIQATIKPGDVLLVEGDTRISTAIKYLTQSTWSHAALYLGPDAGLETGESGESHVLVEADLEAGIRSLPLSFYRNNHTRICRPLGLSEEDIATLTTYSKSRLGHQYDLKNVWDLARYLCPTPPVPTRYRRSMLALGSGDPSRAICSTFIAQGFQSIRYPILPVQLDEPSDSAIAGTWQRASFQVRHHSLFTPRDFDASPYFEVIKPTLAQGFDFRQLRWVD